MKTTNNRAGITPSFLAWILIAALLTVVFIACENTIEPEETTAAKGVPPEPGSRTFWRTRSV